MDWSTLSALSTSSIDPELSERASDVVLSLRITRGRASPRARLAGAYRASADLLDELSAWRGTLTDVLKAPNGVAAFSRLMSYIAQTTEPPPEQLLAFVSQFGPEAEEAVMTTAEIWRAERRKEGLEKGIEEGLKEGRAEMLLRHKFGPIADDVRSRVWAGSDADFARWVERVLTATALEEVFG